MTILQEIERSMLIAVLEGHLQEAALRDGDVKIYNKSVRRVQREMVALQEKLGKK